MHTVCGSSSINLSQFNDFFYKIQYSEKMCFPLLPIILRDILSAESFLSSFSLFFIHHQQERWGCGTAGHGLHTYRLLIAGLNECTSRSTTNEHLKNNNLHNQLTGGPKLLFKFIYNITLSSVNLCSVLSGMIELFASFIYHLCLALFCSVDNVEIMGIYSQL